MEHGDLKNGEGAAFSLSCILQIVCFVIFPQVRHIYSAVSTHQSAYFPVVEASSEMVQRTRQ